MSNDSTVTVTLGSKELGAIFKMLSERRNITIDEAERLLALRKKLTECIRIRTLARGEILETPPDNVPDGVEDVA